MKRQWQRFKAWSARTWQRFKRWVIGILGSLGLITVSLIAAPVQVTYTPATEYEDGTALPIDDIAETRLYCNGDLVATEPGADGSFDDVSGVLPVGTSECYGTHVGVNALESQPSNTITVIVRPSVAPGAPVLDP
jgi:hypothetical protein